MTPATNQEAYENLAVAMIQSAVFDLPRRFKWAKDKEDFIECNIAYRGTSLTFFRKGYFHFWADVIRASYDILMEVYEERKEWVLRYDVNTKKWIPYTQEERDEDEQLDNLIRVAHRRGDSGDVIIQHNNRAAGKAYRRAAADDHHTGGWNR